MFVRDFVQNNGQGWFGSGPVGSQLEQIRFNPELRRPYIDERGRAVYDQKVGMTFNEKTKIYEPEYEVRPLPRRMRDNIDNALMLRKEEWVRFDQVLVEEARARLRFWSDLAGSTTYGGFDGMSVSVLENETVSDPGFAMVDMDGTGESPNDAPKYQLEGIPLPITHSDFYFSDRLLAESRNKGTPLSQTMPAFAARRVMETVEQTAIGNITGITYGSSPFSYGRTSKVYGLTNFTPRQTKTNFTAPSGGGWTPDDTVNELLAAREQLFSNNFYGPFMVYTSTDWDQYLDRDYSLSGGNNPNQTLRERIKRIDGIVDVRRLDYLTSTFTIILIQMTPQVCRAVIGMNPTTISWDTKGGLLHHFKVMCIMVPQFFATQSGKCGILHGTTT